MLANRKRVETALIARGARAVGAAKLIDYWFCPKRAKNIRQASTDQTGFALRIRESKDLYSGRTVSALECKSPVDGKNHAFCHEHEIDLTNTKEMRAILSDIGFKEFLMVRKRRLIYYYRGAKFCFDSIQGMGEGLEIEMNARKSQRTEAHQKLAELTRSLGIGPGEIVRKSLTYIAMQKLAKF